VSGACAQTIVEFARGLKHVTETGARATFITWVQLLPCMRRSADSPVRSWALASVFPKELVSYNDGGASDEVRRASDTICDMKVTTKDVRTACGRGRGVRAAVSASHGAARPPQGHLEQLKSFAETDLVFLDTVPHRFKLVWRWRQRW
jgi:hypothetical protein